MLNRIVDVALFPDTRSSDGTVLFDFGDVRRDALDGILGPPAEKKDSVVRKHRMGVPQGGEPLFLCTGNGKVADVAINGLRAPMPLGRFCDRILEACGLEPLSGLETEASLRRKLRMPFPLSKTVAREP